MTGTNSSKARRVVPHDHERWQIRDDGCGPYCAACGEPVPTTGDPDMSERDGAAVKPAHGWPDPDPGDPKWRTANGVSIVDGLRVWDYDLKSGTVDLAKTFGDHFTPGESYWDGWFYVLVDGDGHHSLMDGTRMTTVHPFTHQPPPDKPDHAGTGPGA